MLNANREKQLKLLINNYLNSKQSITIHINMGTPRIEIEKNHTRDTRNYIKFTEFGDTSPA